MPPSRTGLAVRLQLLADNHSQFRLLSAVMWAGKCGGLTAQNCQAHGRLPGKLCCFEGPGIHFSSERTGGRLRFLSYQDVSGKMDKRAWAREGWEWGSCPALGKPGRCARYQEPAGWVRSCTGSRTLRTSGQTNEGINPHYPSSIPRSASAREHPSLALVLSESDRQSARLWEEHRNRVLGFFFFFSFLPQWNRASKLSPVPKSWLLIYKVRLK